MSLTNRYSFCESVTATSRSPWCIRLLTKQGRKCGGGIDTPSLCGRVQPPNGWDIAVSFTLNMPRTVTCRRCVEVYMAHEVTKK